MTNILPEWHQDFLDRCREIAEYDKIQEDADKHYEDFNHQHWLKQKEAEDKGFKKGTYEYNEIVYGKELADEWQEFHEQSSEMLAEAMAELIDDGYAE